MPSRDAVRRAERALESGEKGIRDEVGFSAIHDAYANRFFPGTSVQHTRLRYALFVPWIYRRLIARGVKQSLERELAREEVALVGRLSSEEKLGVIARTIYPRPAKLPPSVIYWSALGTWGLLRHDEGGVSPSRATVHRRIEAQAGAARKRASMEFEAEEPYDPFYALPAPPEGWEDNDSSLSFTLEQEELEYMTEKLRAVKKPGGSAAALLSLLVDARVVPDSMYSSEVTRLADPDDRRALRQARCAAAMGAVGRAIYAAIVEGVCETEDGRDSVGNMHREHLLNEILPKYREQALKIDLEELQSDVPRIADALLVVLRETRRWLQGSMTDVMPLRDCYAASEHRRKGDRARLPFTGLARDRRHEWQPGDMTLATPLHYRWPITRQFLTDLR